jgi:hypothetical protein
MPLILMPSMPLTPSPLALPLVMSPALMVMQVPLLVVFVAVSRLLMKDQRKKIVKKIIKKLPTSPFSPHPQ